MPSDLQTSTPFTKNQNIRDHPNNREGVVDYDAFFQKFQTSFPRLVLGSRINTQQSTLVEIIF